MYECKQANPTRNVMYPT